MTEKERERESGRERGKTGESAETIFDLFFMLSKKIKGRILGAIWK